LNRKCIKNGLKYLHENYQPQNEYIHTKWLYASILSRECSWEDEIVKEMVEEILMEMTGTMPASMKTWMLCSFALDGIEHNDTRLINMINGIKQDQNGSLKSEYDESYRVNATLELLKVYKYYVENVNELGILTCTSF